MSDTFCHRRGAVLIVVLGVLTVLALLGTAFVTLQTIERATARNYVDEVRARLVARSGIDSAVARLLSLAEEGALGLKDRTWRYFGNDIAEAGEPSLLAVPLSKAKNPSFAVEADGDPSNGDPTPRPVKVGGVEIGLSGFHETGTYGAHGDFYSLRVRDLQGAIYVNDGVGIGAASDANGDGSVDDRDSSVSQNLRRMLNNLGAISSVQVSGLGDSIVSKRPAGGYRHLRQLERILGPTNFAKVEHFLTVHAWVDSNVSNPVPLSAAVLSEYPVLYHRGDGVYRYGRNRDATGQLIPQPLTFDPAGQGNAVYGLDELNPQWIEIVSRAPVNVNTAPREVLIALLAGLQGFFLMEPRYDNVPSWESAYNWVKYKHSYGPSGAGFSKIGFLYKTVPIVGPGSGTVTEGISAEAIADHMIACRRKAATPQGVLPASDYSAVWFGGPFGSWRQFEAFCDHLVKIGLLVDDRPFLDYLQSGGTLSKIQRRAAARAIADVLKANFNPNLHLNETNPDSNLHRWVDKTDLIVNSTEFCFLPLGYFEIESIGRVVRPLGGTDAFTAPDNRLLASKRVSAVVKLYDVHRETHQKHFSAGEISARTKMPATNSNRSLEVGPEPNQGAVPLENEWDGYLALSTAGGVSKDKAANSVEPTPSGDEEMDEKLHAHFSHDFDLHYHVNGIRKELASSEVPGEYVRNIPDRTESLPGPYAPTSGGGNLYRLARSFRIKPGQTLPPLSFRAPLDLRIDGAYSERHSAPAYWLSHEVIGPTLGESQGVIAFWIKPSYYPEMSGKPRINVDLGRFHKDHPSYPGRMQPTPFLMMFTPTHDRPAYDASIIEGTNPFYNYGNPMCIKGFRPMSFAWGYGYSNFTGYGSCGVRGGTLTPTLNHESHPDNQKPSHLRGHRWTHVVLQWRTASKEECRIFVNGQILPGTQSAWHYWYQPITNVDYTKHEAPDGSQNSLRFGAVSRYRNEPTSAYARNWPADATIDEIYVWSKSAATSAALTLWQDGRYVRPHTKGEGVYTSGPIAPALSRRVLPPAAEVAPPFTSGPAGGSLSSSFVPASEVRILGASWTWFAEEADGEGKEILRDAASGLSLHPKVTVSLVTEGGESASLEDARLGGFRNPDGSPVRASSPFRYRVRFSIPDAQADSILLATPVFDDITIFYRSSDPIFVSYLQE